MIRYLYFFRFTEFLFYWLRKNHYFWWNGNFCIFFIQCKKSSNHRIVRKNSLHIHYIKTSTHPFSQNRLRLRVTFERCTETQSLFHDAVFIFRPFFWKTFNFPWDYFRPSFLVVERAPLSLWPSLSVCLFAKAEFRGLAVVYLSTEGYV